MRKKTTFTLTMGMLLLSWLPLPVLGASDNGPGLAREQPDSFIRSPFVAAFDPSYRLYQPPIYPLVPEPPPASFLRSPFVAAFDPATQLYQMPVYNAKPDVPPGMCRWERFVLDGYGRPVLDSSGQPVKEYAIGPCP
jgi:hypothetical protein